jgi:hypothetical protein
MKANPILKDLTFCGRFYNAYLNVGCFYENSANLAFLSSLNARCSNPDLIRSGMLRILQKRRESFVKRWRILRSVSRESAHFLHCGFKEVQDEMSGIDVFCFDEFRKASVDGAECFDVGPITTKRWKKGFQLAFNDLVDAYRWFFCMHHANITGMFS